MCVLDGLHDARVFAHSSFYNEITVSDTHIPLYTIGDSADHCLFAGTIEGNFLPPQLVYEGKTPRTVEEIGTTQV